MIYNELNTPCFVVNKQILDGGISLLTSSLEKYWNNYIVGYSFKTNSLPWVVDYAKKNGFYANLYNSQFEKANN